MNILLIGNGAREHCIAEALTKSGRVELATFAKAKNPGIFALSKEYQLGNYTDFPAILDFAKRVKPDFAFLGPDDPIADGVADLLLELEIHSVAPLKTVARLESSKSFTRDLVQKYGIPGNPKFKIFYDKNRVSDFLEELGGHFVIKADGLMGGKGVQVSGEHLFDISEGESYANKCIEKFGRVVIEEKLIGQEFSLMSFVDGMHVVDMVPVQDHKRAFVDDKGPNCYSADTEILTNNGWKTFDKLKSSDNVMTFDPKTDVLKLEKPKKIYWMPHNGKMFHFKHRSIDLLVTPNHRMLVEQRKNRRKRFVVEARDYQGEQYILQTGVWHGEDVDYFFIPEFDYKFNRKIFEKRISFKTWARFLGIYLAEGCISKEKKGGWRVYVCQNRSSANFLKIKKIVTAMPYPVTFEKKGFRINSTQLAKELIHFGYSYEKSVPSYIKNASPKIILEFLKAYCLGDGDIHYGKMRFCSSSKQMVDDIQEMILKLGYSSIITKDKRTTMINPLNGKRYPARPIYSLEMKTRKKTSIRIGMKHYGCVNYKGYVGCVTVSTGFVVVRRNNRVAISGNTGGMGSYSDSNHLLPFLTQKDLDEAHAVTEKVAAALVKETGAQFKGIMYGGFMAVKDGIKLIEYNARFGDPEVMNVLPILKTDFVEICETILSGNLDKIKIDFERKATVCKYIVPEGYPDKPRSGEKIEVEEEGKRKKEKGGDLRMYYASVDQKPDGLYLSSSRAIAFVGIADNLEKAEQIAESACGNVKGPVFYRPDIGTKALIEKRMKMMKDLRGC